MDDFFNPQSNTAADPASDFLAREREILGADAAAFGASSNSASDFGNYEASASAYPDLEGDDALASFTTAPALAFYGSATGGPTFGDAQRQQVSVTADNEFAAFENEYPEVVPEPTAPQVS